MKWINVDLEWCDKLINRLINDYDYEMVQVEEGNLGLGDVVMIPTRENHYFFIIREVYLNEWSSGHQYMKCRELPKKWAERVHQLEWGD